MMDITIVHWKISPYFLCLLSSFILGYFYIGWYLKKAGIKWNHIFYSEFLSMVLALYFGAFYTMLVQLAERGRIDAFGFSSLGGMAGIILGVWIFNKITKAHQETMWSAYVLALGLIYAVSKLGCFFAGCCEGVLYKGVGCIRYLDNGAAGPYRFPVQLTETICFLLAFFILHKIAKKKEGGIVTKSLLLYAALKFALDYLRFYEHRKVLSTNQAVCLLVIVIVLGVDMARRLRTTKEKNENEKRRIRGEHTN